MTEREQAIRECIEAIGENIDKEARHIELNNSKVSKRTHLKHTFKMFGYNQAKDEIRAKLQALLQEDES